MLDLGYIPIPVRRFVEYSLCNQHPVAERVKDTFYKARGCACVVPADPLLKRLVPDLSYEAGVRLYPAAPFSWYYESGGELRPHTDKDSGIWSVSIPLFLSASWSLTCEDKAFDSEVGRAVFMNGGRKVHSRPPFEGKALILMLSYREDEKLAHDERTKLCLET